MQKSEKIIPAKYEYCSKPILTVCEGSGMQVTCEGYISSLLVYSQQTLVCLKGKVNKREHEIRSNLFMFT